MDVLREMEFISYPAKQSQLNFLLECNYVRDQDGTLCMGPQKYILKMKETYMRLFGSNPKEYQSSLEPNDNPELDLGTLTG